METIEQPIGDRCNHTEPSIQNDTVITRMINP